MVTDAERGGKVAAPAYRGVPGDGIFPPRVLFHSTACEKALYRVSRLVTKKRVRGNQGCDFSSRGS